MTWPKIFLDELGFHSNLLPDRFQVIEPIMEIKWFEELCRHPQQSLLLAEHADEAVGLVLLVVMEQPQDPIYKPRRFVYVDELAVLTKVRGHGIGRQLMMAAHAWAAARKISEVNPLAVSFNFK